MSVNQLVFKISLKLKTIPLEDIGHKFLQFERIEYIFLNFIFDGDFNRVEWGKKPFGLYIQTCGRSHLPLVI